MLLDCLLLGILSSNSMENLLRAVGPFCIGMAYFLEMFLMAR